MNARIIFAAAVGFSALALLVQTAITTEHAINVPEHTTTDALNPLQTEDCYDETLRMLSCNDLLIETAATGHAMP